MYTSKEFFKENQKELLRLANTEGGRSLLGIKDRDPVIKIVPHGYHQLKDFIGDKAVVQAKFFYEDWCAELAYSLIKTRILLRDRHVPDPYRAFLHYAGLENKEYPQIYLATFTSSTYLGGVGSIDHNNATFATMHDAATGTGTLSSFQVQFDKSASGGTVYFGRRLYLPIDTSSIGVGATVTDTTKLDFLGNRFLSTPSENILVVLTQTTQATTSSVVTSDWGNKGSGAQGSATLSETNNTATAETFTFNATGKPFIITTGTSLLGVREVTYDIGNTAPTATDGNYFAMTGTKTLTVTYTPGPGISRGYALWL